jgi:diacylglycerol O-acyltransferase / wax synthase
MKQLSGLDATFLYLETPQMPMHVGALHVFELPAGSKGRFVVTLRKHIAERLPVAPVLRRRLWWMPLNLANPAWVDAEPDLREHIVEIKLPKGADMAELEAEVGVLHPVLLDRQRPLWKMHVFEGLKPGPGGARRVALYTQLHHAAVDGQAAVALANAIMDLSPAPRAIDARPSGRQRVFSLDMTQMLRGVIGGQAQKVAQIIRGLPATVGTLKDAAGQAVSTSSLLGGKKGVSNLTLAPRTALNTSISTRRAFASVTLPLRELKALGRAHDATINDMVLMLCSTALRRYFGKRHTLPRKSLVAAVPITLREKGDTTADNQASMSLISLGTNIADTRNRGDEVGDGLDQEHPADRLPVARPALVDGSGHRAVRQGARGRPHPAGGEPGDLERARPAGAAVHGRRAHADQLPDLDHRARHGAEHHRAELRPVARLRPDGRRCGHARCARTRRCDPHRLRRREGAAAAR